MISEFWQALVMPSRWRICGIPVNALSCWHSYALEQTGNAYAYDSHELIKPTKDDVAGLIMVCGLDWQDGRRLYTDDRFSRDQSVKAFRLMRNKPFDQLDAACRDYSQTCRTVPDAWVEESKGGPRKFLGGPVQFHIVRVLCSEYGYTVPDAWNECYSVARAYFDVARESRGECEIVGDRTHTMLERAKAVANG